MNKSCKTLRELLKTECVAIPGAYNGLVARSVAENGNLLVFRTFSQSLILCRLQSCICFRSRCYRFSRRA
mgnify:FL=1